MPDIVPIPLTTERKKEVANYLIGKLDNAIKSRSTQVEDKYRRWLDNYSGKPLVAVRTTPFYRASNFVPQLIRMHTDILAARLLGIVFGTHPMWKPRTFIPASHEWIEELTGWLEYTTLYELELFEVMDAVVQRMLKGGTCILKHPWVEYDYFLGGAGEGGNSFSEKAVNQKSLRLQPVAFDDFWVYPLTVEKLSDVHIKFQRVRLTEEQVRARIATRVWDQAAAELLLKGGPEPEKGNARTGQAIEAGIHLSPDVSLPFSVIEAWLDYPITNDASRPFKIVVVFNPAFRDEKSILRAYFNFYSTGIDPYNDFRLFRREDLFYGYSLPEILEQSQEEMAQIHNARRDSNMIANIPGWKKRRYADVPNPSTTWYPGKVFELEDMDDLQPLQFGGNYNSMMEEESFAMQMAERLSGVGPPMQGYGAGTLEGGKGTYSSMGTMALLAEGNKRLDIFIRRLRQPMHRTGNLIYQSYRDFNPNGVEYTMWGAKGEAVRKTFEFRETGEKPGPYFDISASDGAANREMDRQSLLLMGNTMAAYYRQVSEAASMVTQIPPDHPLREAILMVLDGAKDLADRILFAFDIGDRKRLVPDLRAVLGGGTPNEGPPGAAGQGGLPPTEDSVSESGLRDLSENLTTLSAAGAGRFGGR